MFVLLKTKNILYYKDKPILCSCFQEASILITFRVGYLRYSGIKIAISQTPHSDKNVRSPALGLKTNHWVGNQWKVVFQPKIMIFFLPDESYFLQQ